MLLEKYGVIESWSFDGNLTEVEFANAFHLMEEAGLIDKE